MSFTIASGDLFYVVARPYGRAVAASIDSISKSEVYALCVYLGGGLLPRGQ